MVNMSRRVGDSRWATSEMNRTSFVANSHPRRSGHGPRRDYSHAPPPPPAPESKNDVKLSAQPITFVKSSEGLPGTISSGRTPGPVVETHKAKQQPAPPSVFSTAPTLQSAPASVSPALGSTLPASTRAQQRITQVSRTLSPPSATQSLSDDLTLAGSIWATADEDTPRRFTLQQSFRDVARQERIELLHKGIRRSAARSAQRDVSSSPLTPATNSESIPALPTSPSKDAKHGSVLANNGQTIQPTVASLSEYLGERQNDPWFSKPAFKQSPRLTPSTPTTPPVAPPVTATATMPTSSAPMTPHIASSVNTTAAMLTLSTPTTPLVAPPMKTAAAIEEVTTSSQPAKSSVEPVRRKKKVSTVRIAGPAGTSSLSSQSSVLAEHNSSMSISMPDVITPLVDGVRSLSLTKDAKSSAPLGLLSSPEVIFKKMGSSTGSYGRTGGPPATSKHLNAEPVENREELAHFTSWGKPTIRESGPAEIRSVILTGLPPNTTITEVASLVWGGILDRVDYTSGSGRARVRFMKSVECQKYFSATVNGVVHPTRKVTVFVELGQEVEPISGRLRQAVDVLGATRCVKSIGVDADRSFDFLKRKAEGTGNLRKILMMRAYKSGSTQARAVEWHFDSIEAAQSFAMELRRDEAFEHTNVQFADDPCALAQGPHYP